MPQLKVRRRTFNCGIGMTVCVAEEHAAAAGDLLRQHGEEVFDIGVIEPAHADSARVIFE